MMTTAVTAFVALLTLGSAETALTRSDTPITESVTIGTGPDSFTFGADDIPFNQCQPYEPKKYGAIKVCGANTKVQIFLRGRCEGYYAYVEEVGACKGATTDDCREASPDSNHWLKAAQSYVIVPCGAGQGEVNDYKGPACKGMDECIKYAQEQGDQEAMDKMEAKYKEGWTGKGHALSTGRKAKAMGLGYRPDEMSA